MYKGIGVQKKITRTLGETLGGESHNYTAGSWGSSSERIARIKSLRIGAAGGCLMDKT